MVFEDLQWADDGLLDFIDHLPNERVTIHCRGDARPAGAPRPPAGLGLGKQRFTSLYLEPLPGRDG